MHEAFARRGADPRLRAARDAAVLAAELDALHDGCLAVIAARPSTRAVAPLPGDVEGTYRLLLAAIDDTP